MSEEIRPPVPLPPGGPVELPGRGTTFVRYIDGPANAPTLFLLHGWTASADLNWCTSFDALGQRFRVLAIDHRGHGRGIRSRRAFHLRDCADDVAAVCEHFGIDRIIPVGYSMGGPIAQLTWKRHPDLVEGLVLCATSRLFNDDRQFEGVLFNALPALALASRLTPDIVMRQISQRLTAGRFDDSPVARWAVSEFQRADRTKLIEAGASLGRYDSSPWIGRVDVPTAVVLTEHDNAVPPARQLALAQAIPGAKVVRVSGDHSVCFTNPRAFVPALVRACSDVAERARRTAAA